VNANNKNETQIGFLKRVAFLIILGIAPPFKRQLGGRARICISSDVTLNEFLHPQW
jgi:hypothetical protein